MKRLIPAIAIIVLFAAPVFAHGAPHHFRFHYHRHHCWHFHFDKSPVPPVTYHDDNPQQPNICLPDRNDHCRS
jgi:hypothetical protein